MAATPKQPLSIEMLGARFVKNYYNLLHSSPLLVYLFYLDESQLVRPEADGSMSVTTTQDLIEFKINSLEYHKVKAHVQSFHTRKLADAGFEIFVTGYFTGKEITVRSFAQIFHIVPKGKQYFVLSDTLRYVDPPPTPVNGVVGPAPVVQEKPVLEHSLPAVYEAAIAEKLADESIFESEKVLVAEVVDDEVQGDKVLELRETKQNQMCDEKNTSLMHSIPPDRK